MIRPILATLVVSLVTATTAFGQVAPDQSADRLLAAESFRHSAGALVLEADAPARAARLVVIAEMAEKLDPGNSETNRLLADIFQSQAQLTRATKSLRTCMAEGRDHSLAMRWMAVMLEGMDNAAQRTEFLKSTLADRTLSPTLRSEAAVEWAAILARQGRRQDQLDAYRQAIELDSGQPLAIHGLIDLAETPSEAAAVKAMFSLLRGNPLAASAAWQLAILLDSLGMHTESVEMFEYAESVFNGTARAEGQRPSPLFVVQYCSAMLDAGRANEAIEKFSPSMTSPAENLDLAELLVEAYRTTGKTAEADELVKSLENVYKRRFITSSIEAELAGEMAWFLLVTNPSPADAYDFAARALQDNDNPLTQRIIGVAELTGRRRDEGAPRLRELMSTDMYAAAFLAEYYFSHGDAEAGQAAIEAGAAISQAGPAFRRLRAIATANSVAISAAPGSKEAREALGKFDRGYLEMGTAPERFLAVEMHNPAKPIRPGEPVTIRATLTNKGPLPMPVGAWGLFSPAMRVQVTVSSRQEDSFDDLPLMVWPAPRYLAPGAAITTELRLDVGELGDFLAVRPFDDLKLSVSGMLDPLQQGDQFRSTLPSVKIAPVVLNRPGLLRSADRSDAEACARAYQLALGRVVRDLRSKNLAKRMSAARRTGALLAMADRIRYGRSALPSALTGLIDRPVMLSLLRAMLADSSAAVRAEMLASLRHVRLDRSIMLLLADVLADPSAVVRLRAAELVGCSNLPDRRAMLSGFASDPNELVRRMAAAFRPARSR